MWQTWSWTFPFFPWLLFINRQLFNRHGVSLSSTDNWSFSLRKEMSRLSNTTEVGMTIVMRWGKMGVRFYVWGLGVGHLESWQRLSLFLMLALHPSHSCTFFILHLIHSGSILQSQECEPGSCQNFEIPGIISLQPWITGLSQSPLVWYLCTF